MSPWEGARRAVTTRLRVLAGAGSGDSAIMVLRSQGLCNQVMRNQVMRNPK